MLFNSYDFIFLYLPVVVIVYFYLGQKHSPKWASAWMVLVSLFFYGYWDWRYVPLLLASMGFNYFVGQKIESAASRRLWLYFGVLTDLALLGYFKYAAFFLKTVNDVAGTMVFDVPHIVLPLGISFFTFTQIAYLVDTYRCETKSGGFLSYAEFVTIFPHLIAGPILNHKKMIPQFLHWENYAVNWDNIARGLALFLMGLFKKACIADGLAGWINELFGKIHGLTCYEAWLGAIGYTFQLYFDFSAYSEMAVGLALIFNFRFPTNFDSPYQASNIIDFWRRWHMSLGAWVKEYLYIPMGGGRNGAVLKMRNLLVSMLLIGFWHGAGWTFIVWGALHGLYLVINHLWRQAGLSLPKVISWPLTFLAVTVAWVFFRADSLTDACSMISVMLYGRAISWNAAMSSSLGVCSRLVLGTGIALALFPNPQRLLERYFSFNVRWLALLFILSAGSFYAFSHISDFLYFQF